MTIAIGIAIIASVTFRATALYPGGNCCFFGGLGRAPPRELSCETILEFSSARGIRGLAGDGDSFDGVALAFVDEDDDGLAGVAGVLRTSCGLGGIEFDSGVSFAA